MAKHTITEKKAKQTPAGGVLVGKRQGQTIIHDKGSEGGYFVGRLHKEGGIKGINKSTGQPIEVQGGEVIITAPAVADQTKREFEGEMLTNREILSKINEKGGGVSLENGGEILINGTAYNYGGMTMTDYEIMQKMNECGCDDDDFEYEFKKGGSVITYKNKYNKKYGYSKDESHSLEEISKDTGVSLKGLQQIYNKGIGAYKTNPSSVRPNVKSKEQWAMARVYSAVMGGKASKVDSNELVMDKGGKTLRNKEVYNEGTDGVAIGAVTVPLSDAVAGFDATNGAGTIAGFELGNIPLVTNMGTQSQVIAENGVKLSYSDGGSTKELVEFVEIWSAGSSLSSLYRNKYNSFKEFKKAVAEINPNYSYIYIGANGKSIGGAIDVKKDGKNTVKTFNPNTGTPKSFIKAIERSYGSWRMEKYDFDIWLGFKTKITPKPPPQPEPKKAKAYIIKCSIFYLEENFVLDNGAFYFVSSLYNFIKNYKLKDAKNVKVVIDLADSSDVFIGSNTFYLQQENEDFKHFNLEQIPLDIFERLFVNYFPDLDLSELYGGRVIERLSLQEQSDFFSQQPNPIKEEEKKVEKIDFEATKKYLTLRIATLTKELNFKKPRLSNEEIGFYQRDINTLIQKLRNINERQLELLPLKERLENAYGLKWGDINAVYEPAKGLLSANGLPTKLTEQEWISVRNDSFASFFGDWQLANEIDDFSGVSKVIDPDTKEPMPVYHGTNVLFTEWKTYKSNNAHYFAKERDFSTWFAEQWSKGRGDISAVDSNLLKQLNPNKGEYVYRCFLDIKNPIDFSRFGVEKRPVSDFLMFLQINYNIGDFDFWTNFRLFNNLAQDTLVYSWMIIRNWQSFTEYIKMATTYDGYIFYEYHPEKVGTGLNGASLSFCAFDSSQIKFTNSAEFNSLITDSRFNFGGIL